MTNEKEESLNNSMKIIHDNSNNESLKKMIVLLDQSGETIVSEEEFKKLVHLRFEEHANTKKKA